MAEVLELIKEYEQSRIKGLYPKMKEEMLNEIRSKMKNLPTQEIEYLFNIVNSEPKKFPEEIVKEVNFEYTHRDDKLELTA